VETESLDLHGLSRERALEELDRWLNQIFLLDIREARVVCGWGRGIILAVVEAELRQHPLVESYRIDGAGFRVEIVARYEDSL
jgi:dsDNA-specific endonuclease/ATPase MutS2